MDGGEPAAVSMLMEVTAYFFASAPAPAECGLPIVSEPRSASAFMMYEQDGCSVSPQVSWATKSPLELCAWTSVVVLFSSELVITKEEFPIPK